MGKWHGYEEKVLIGGEQRPMTITKKSKSSW
jgi:hypothetical protein